jgi:hypothetical protein
VEESAAGCIACGREPVARVAIRRHVGMIVLQSFYKVKEPLCRECGLELARKWTLRTLWQGWWGYISFFVNWFVLAMNLRALLAYRALPQPQLSTPSHEVLQSSERDEEESSIWD